MASEAAHTTRDPRAEHPCPACGQPRAVIARRHKVLGAWVPEWEVQPCRNPGCELYEPPEAGAEEADIDEAGTEAGAGARADEAGPARSADDGAEATTTHVTGKNGETGRSPAPG
ncbi:hypothetical protein ACIGO8_02160 [Streptomyces sp. NPDC053493]|uniref:hypothetical protein n=1 Tax=Streptomyces sp. NPDC053493 TaxID=3365705 RepID=UPI0037D741BF